MNKKVTLKDIAIMQSGIYMKTDSQGEVRYLQVKDVNSENKLDLRGEKRSVSICGRPENG